MICFIVLHYMVMEQTIECVDCLLQLNGEKKIIIVDNASKNGSGKKLELYYSDSDDIVVILNEENLGFARGNNVGCAYAREVFHPDYYVVMNNDVLIRQKDFIGRIKSIDEQESFDVLGPDIFAVRTNDHQSPKSLQNMTIKRAEFIQKSLEHKIKGGMISSIKYFLKQIKFVDNFYEKVVRREPKIDRNHKHYNVPIQGS